jgi:hypothetical protein
MASVHPQTWEALRTWHRTGTTLGVYGVGSDYEHVSRLEKLMDLPAGGDAVGGKLAGWERPRSGNFRETVRALEYAGSNYNAKSTKEVPEKTMAPADDAPFMWRSAGQGQLVAIASENPFPGTTQFWSAIFNSIASRHWLWYQRHGISLMTENEEFWNFLIPGIGRAPVFSFLALISLFAIVIGPVNYLLLHRRGRLYLLLVTVPVGALLVTGGLFLYATLADGLGVRARVRSVTDIDQRRGQSISWSRHSYYAGLAPSGGLVFPADAAVYPIDHWPTSGMGMEDATREIRWGDDQRLVSGYFLSRTSSQLLVVEPRETTAGLRILEPDGDEPVQVVNELGASIRRLMVCDSQGRHHAGSEIAVNVTSNLEPADLAAESTQWWTLLNAHRPEYPEGFTPSQLENVMGIFGSPFRYSNTLAPASLKTGTLELTLGGVLAKGPAGKDFTGMRPRSYVAVVERPPLVSLGVESAEELAGLHVIVGSW